MPNAPFVQVCCGINPAFTKTNARCRYALRLQRADFRHFEGEAVRDKAAPTLFHPTLLSFVDDPRDQSSRRLSVIVTERQSWR